jgi:hypothetical protein
MEAVNFIADAEGFLQDGYNIYNRYNNALSDTTQGHVVQGFEHVVDSLQPFTTRSTFSKTLDTESNYCRDVDLLKHLDDDHLLKKLSMQTAACCQMPVNTVFLVLLGAFSSVSCRKWVVGYPHGGSLPIGIYAVVEQPSGTGKTRCLTVGQKPFSRIKTDVVNAYRESVKQLQDIAEPSESQAADLKELLARKPAINSRLFISNATAEGMEQTLSGTQGFFSAISSEQGLFNSLLGLSYSNAAPNNDLVLNGFDGGHISSCRVTRDGFYGHVIGGITLFAQQGSVEKILACSNGTGMSERFLMLAEPHLLGQRDHLKKIPIDPSLDVSYANACEFARDIFNEPKGADDLLLLNISDAGHRMIAECRNKIEPDLLDGGRYSHISVRGAAGKVNMQIMKIAANLYLLDRRDNYDPNIPDSIVKSAIGIAHDLLEANLALCKAKGLIGERAEFTAILSLFESNHKPMMTERQIIQSRSRVVPFKDFTGNKSDLIRESLAAMESEGLLASLVIDGAKRYLLKQ